MKIRVVLSVLFLFLVLPFLLNGTPIEHETNSQVEFLQASDSEMELYYSTGSRRFRAQAKTYLRRHMLRDRKNPAARVRLGIINSDIVQHSIHMQTAGAAEAAHRMLNDRDIELLEDRALAHTAYASKSALFGALLDPLNSQIYREKALQIFPGRPVTGGSNAAPEAKRLGMDIKMPYYIDLGYQWENRESILLFPIGGIGLRKSAFSSSVFANAGVKYYRKNFNMSLKYFQAFIPDFSSFDYDFLESYGIFRIATSFKGNTLYAELKGGWLLFAEESTGFIDLKPLAFRAPGVQETIGLDLFLADDGLNKISGNMAVSILQVPGQNHYTWSLQAAMPVTFDLYFLELGLLPRLFHSGYINERSGINRGKRHFIYDNAVILSTKDADAAYFRFYETSAAVDFVCRLFAFPLKASADRLYFGLNFSTGIGLDNMRDTTDFLYAAGISAGFDYNDNTPFEIRFGIDQDGDFFVYLTMVNRIYHKF